MGLFIVVVIFFAIVIGLMYMNQKARTKNALKNTDVLPDVLKGLHAVVDGKEYYGSESEIITKYKINWDDPRWNRSGNVTYLCKTDSGNWFDLEIYFKDGIINEKQIKPLQEVHAKNRFANDLNMYKKHFGEPEKA